MTKQDKINQFDPNAAAEDKIQLYGLPFTKEEADVIVIPVPWEATVSYGGGTSQGPKAVFDASFQVDLEDPYVQDAWTAGIALDEYPEYWELKSKELKERTPDVINPVSEELNAWVEKRASHWLQQGKLVVSLGGEHSTPLGLMRAIGKKHGSFSILQIDAHADLRQSFEGYEHSHASIMFNALKEYFVEKLVQVGIRDYCMEELEIINNDKRVKTYFDLDIKKALFAGGNWKNICHNIVAGLADKVYISFDIDGLDPKLCPHTGTPVPGGFEFEEAIYLINTVVESGKTIVGFDLSEVAPGKTDWDANVGARVLYRLANLMSKSNGIIPNRNISTK